MTDLMNPPDDLPVPQDDGAASHLKGMKLPSLALESTREVFLTCPAFKTGWWFTVIP